MFPSPIPSPGRSPGSACFATSVPGPAVATSRGARRVRTGICRCVPAEAMLGKSPQRMVWRRAGRAPLGPCPGLGDFPSIAPFEPASSASSEALPVACKIHAGDSRGGSIGRAWAPRVQAQRREGKDAQQGKRAEKHPSGGRKRIQGERKLALSLSMGYSEGVRIETPRSLAERSRRREQSQGHRRLRLMRMPETLASYPGVEQ